MDIFFLFLPISLETTWGFISQISSCRIWWAGGNSFKISCTLPEAEFGFRQNLVLVPDPAHGGGRRAPRLECAPREPARSPLRGPARSPEERESKNTEHERAAQGRGALLSLKLHSEQIL